MKYKQFEDLPVWKSAIELALAAYDLTERRTLAGAGDHCDQLRRAALSVSNNIAEGFELGTTPGLLNALYIARGSAGETRSIPFKGAVLTKQNYGAGFYLSTNLSGRVYFGE